MSIDESVATGANENSADSAENNADGGMPTYVLEPSVTMQTVEGALAALRKKPLNTCDILMLDSSRVEVITTPGIQLVLSAAKTVELHGGIFLITKPTAAFKQAFTDAGFAAWLSQREASHG